MAEGEETQEYGNHALPPYVEESQIEVPSSPERDAGQRGPGEPSAPVVSVQDQLSTLLQLVMEKAKQVSEPILA